MNIQFFSKNLHIEGDIKEYVEDKVKKAVEILERVDGVQVDIFRDQHHRKGDVYRVKVKVRLPRKKFISADFQAPNVKAAVDLVRGKLEAQARKYKERLNDDKKRGWKRLWPF